MDREEGYNVNGFVRRNSVLISQSPPSLPTHREAEEPQFTVNDIIAVLSSEDSSSNEEECDIKDIPPATNFNIERVTSKQDDIPSTSNNHPVIQTVNTEVPRNYEVPNRNIQEPIPSIFQYHQKNQNQRYEELAKIVTAIAEDIKMLKDGFGKYVRKTKKKYKKKSRKHYSSDSTSTSSDFSSSTSSRSIERRRKKRRHGHKPSRSHWKRHADSSSEYSSGKYHRNYYRHCYGSCKCTENFTKLNKNRVSVPQNHQSNNSYVNDSIHYQNEIQQNKNETQSLQNEPSSSHQSGLQARRRNANRQSRSERPIIETDNSDNDASSGNTFSPFKRTQKSINRPTATVSFQRRKSINKGVTAQDIFRPPNTNKNLYLAHKNAAICQICKKHAFRIVSHYKRYHENSEVYVSRISQKMVEKAENGLPYAKKTINKIMAFCYFCEDRKEFGIPYWMDHYRTHTGEYAYKCDSCDRMYGVAPRECCRRPLKKIIYDDLYENDLTAFICNLCNFLQIDEKSVQKHLRNEHENVADNQYHEILLLPSSKNLSKYCI